jgi:hypothetical protein
MTLRPAILSLCLALWCFDSSAQTARQFLVNPAPAQPASPATDIPRTDSQPAESKPATATEPSLGSKAAETNGSKDDSGNADAAAASQTQFRVERIPVVGGAELITIFARLDGLRSPQALSSPEVPLISVVRDTLADADPENDRLRYVWMLTYTQPNLLKRIASAVPFLYQHVGNQTQASNSPPKPIVDLANTSRQTWNRFFWTGMQRVFLDSYGIPIKASTRTYRRNAADYRQGHVMQALSILDNYERLRQRTRNENELLALSARTPTGSLIANAGGVADAPTPMLFEMAPAFTPGEMLELRARLILSRSTFGGLLGPDKFAGTVVKRTMSSVDNSGHNWELLRQRAEAEGLFFEPLTMPDGQATHAILWIAKSDLNAQPNREFHDRFLNIKNPWKDNRLRNWNGYSRISYFDRDSRPATATDAAARPMEMIPLALYGLDHPKIPALLIDFRDNLNPKKREMSQRIFNDLAKNIFSLSNFGNLPYFAGRSLFDFVTGRRGMDVNQPTRLRSYSELKLLLSFNSTIDQKLRDEIERRVQNVSLNPLNNDNESEVRLARQQYDALVDYARRPGGLSAKIERDRAAEMVPLEHGRTARFFYNLANVLSFGRYLHREKATPELYARLEMARRIERHTQFLAEVAKSSPQTEVAWDMANVNRSLQFLAEQGSGASAAAAKAAAAIFQKTNDPDARRLCLEALSKINNKTARTELLRAYEKEAAESELRKEIADRLRKAVAADASIKPAEAKSLLNLIGAP